MSSFKRGSLLLEAILYTVLIRKVVFYHEVPPYVHACAHEHTHTHTHTHFHCIPTLSAQERGVSSHTCDTLRLHYKLDNEFELVFVVAYQKILQLSYIDRLLEQSYLVFRDRYKNELTQGTFNATFDFSAAFGVIHGQLEEEFRAQKMQPKAMRSFGETAKGKKAGKKEDTKMKGGGEVESLPLSFGENDAVAVEETGGEGEVEADGGEMNGAMEGNGEGEEEEAEGARTRSLPSKLVAKQIRGGRRVGGVKKGKPPVGAR